MVAKLPLEPTEFGKRVLAACKEEGRSPTGAERDAPIPKGYLSRLIYGTRGGTSVNTEHMVALARLLHVNFEWLVVGTGPMRRGGRGTTPAEEAITFARGQGAREDAIATTWERNKDRVDEMTATDWIVAIDAEVRRLERAGVPRPEVTTAKRDAVKREKTKLKHAKEKRAAADKEEQKNASAAHGRVRRVSGGV